MSGSDEQGGRLLSRREVLSGAGLAAIACAGAGRLPAAAAESRASRLPASAAFDLDLPAGLLFANKALHHRRTIMQSFAIDSVGGRVYVAQTVQSGTPLPGDGPDDPSWSARAKRGDLVLSQLDLHGRLLGHMYLKGFGHGVAIGFESSGDAGYLWTEVDALAEGANEWGMRLEIEHPVSSEAIRIIRNDDGAAR